MARQAEATRVAGLGEDREQRKQNGSRIWSRNNYLVEGSRFSNMDYGTRLEFIFVRLAASYLNAFI
jgi:hypothetical protein